MRKTQDTYKAIYELDDNKWWFVRVPKIPGCHSHGRNIPAARRNIIEAAALCLDVDEDDVHIEDDIRLPGGIGKVVSLARRRREEAERKRHDSQEATEIALRELKSSGLDLSLRDIADLLGVSHQRIHQVFNETKEHDGGTDDVPKAI